MNKPKHSTHIVNDPILYIKMYDEMPAICILLDATLKIISINKYGSKQLGYSQNELMGHSVIELYRDEDKQFVSNNLNSILEQNKLQTNRWECTRIRKDKSHLWVKDTAKQMQVDVSETNCILLVSEDITETRYLINELEKQVSCDALTGLFNRQKFERFIDQTILASQSNIHQDHGLCFIDLDHFRDINEISGNIAGDELLKQVSALIKSEIRHQDILARFDGDKFGLLLSNCNSDETQQILNKILHKISNVHFNWKGEVYNISASAGCITINHTAVSAIESIKRSNTACYLAKKDGRNSIHFYDLSDKELRQHDQMQKNISLLKWAFEHDQLVLHYQEIHPITAVTDTQHLEILIRLINKDGKLVYPDSFIPAAEHYGQVIKLDLWVTHTALQYFNEQTLSHKIICNINLSGETLGSKEFINTTTELLKKYQNPKVTICFEVTETATISNMNKAIEFISHFKKLGCLFALDDFGSGFSSFAYLKSLPVDYLKIDGYFVKNILHDPKDLALVRAIHQVAEIFEIETVAEFIEDESIMTVLKGIGIDYGQGYHLHKPEKLK